MWIFIIYSRIFVVYVAWYRTGQIWEQVLDKFWTSFRQVLDKFCFETCIWIWLNCFFYAWIFLCMYLGTKPDKFGNWEQAPDKFQTSSGQVWTSFVFKLDSELSENQTCPRVVRFYVQICGFCTGCFQFVQKSKLSASCPPPDNYWTSF